MRVKLLPLELKSKAWHSDERRAQSERTLCDFDIEDGDGFNARQGASANPLAAIT